MINMNQRKRFRVSGHILALVVSIVVIVTLMALSMLSLGLNSRTLAVRTTQKIQARCAADAGLTKALYEMNEQLKVKPWDDSSLPYSTDETLPNFDGVFSYKVAKEAGNSYIVTSVGTAGIIEKEIYSTIGFQGLFDHAILTKGQMTLKSNTLIDGYNSTDPGDTDVEVKIGTISISGDQIILNSSVVVDGDVVVGVDGDINTVIKDLGATTGDQYSMLEVPPLPFVTPPVLPDAGMDITVKGGTTTIGPADSGEYTGIDISQKGTLEISGGDVKLYITGDIDLGQGCEFIVESGASLELYVDGDIECKNDSTLGGESFSDPKAFQLYATGAGSQAFDIKAKSDWCGVIYAPNADIILYAKGNCYGSVVSGSFEYKSDGNFYYDEALRNVSANDDYVRFVVKRWSER
ncbi:hypothetical protein ACFL02_05015 [Planctomycetota bacterium]